MDTWAIFWICWFSYLAIKYAVYNLTYDKNKALKDIVREECLSAVEKEIDVFMEKLNIKDKGN